MFRYFSSRMIKNIVLIFCTILVINGAALAADRDVIVGFHQSDVPTKEKLIKDNGGKVKKDFHLINAVSASLPEVEIEKMKKDPRIKYIVADTIFSAADEYTSSWGVQYIGSQPVHNQGINGTGVKIAVLDTGIDYNHEDLNSNFKGGYDFVNNDPDPWDDNCLSFFKTCHGTHVSGIIAAEHNGIGVVGVAPGASIYAVKVLDAGGFGAASLVVSGIEWAVNNNMNIISMSLESTENNTAVLDAVNAAYTSGVLLVAAGGNTGGGPVLYPAAYDSVIAVTAIDQTGQRASFSPIDQKIEVAAPGVSINSTVCIIADPSHCLQGGYGFLSGTSMAAPHVTGVAALINSTNFADVNADGIRDNKDVREIIRNTAFDAGIPGKDDIYGYGIVDASNALLGIPTFSTPSGTGSISGYKINDTNGNGRWDPGETGIPGWTIKLEGKDGLKIKDETSTNDTGFYVFDDLPAGKYKVEEKNHKDWRHTGPNKIDITLAEGADSIHNDFTNMLKKASPIGTGSISGYKINDTNGNGRWDPGETGIPGWTIKLKGKDGLKIKDETSTNDTGFYVFDNLPAGKYKAEEKNHKDWRHTGPNKIDITLAEGADSIHNDFTNMLKRFI